MIDSPERIAAQILALSLQKKVTNVLPGIADLLKQKNAKRKKAIMLLETGSAPKSLYVEPV